MELVGFQVKNYRSIDDSGWIDVDDLTCIVGKNESGKTSLLQALWKFNPYKKNPYSLDREWPRGRRKERSDEAEVCVCRFEFSEKETAVLGQLHETCQGIQSVRIRKEYGGKTWYKFEPNHPPNQPELSWVVSVLEQHLGAIGENASDHFKEHYAEAFEIYVTQIRENGGSAEAVKSLPTFKGQIASHISADGNLHPNDKECISALQNGCDAALEELQVDPPVRLAIDTCSEWLPTFVYMDDYRVFSGRAQLDQVKRRIDTGKPEDDDETIVMIMEQAGLDLAQEVNKGEEEDREQRILDMNDASKTLTDEIADRWSQKKYDVMFQADGQHFITFVKDEGKPVLVPLEERSKGFQWFFSFDMTFMCETKGQFQNAVILLDEPGLHLHASAQKDLMQRMYAYAKTNQLVYSTHLPFMIDPKRLDNIYICEETDEGSKVHQNWETANQDARFTLQAALGLSWSQSLFVGQHNLVVEGVTDYWYLSGFSDILEFAGKQSLPETLVITPAGGASKVAYVGTILRGQELDVCVLLDSDTAGQSAYEQLVHKWILDEKLALRLGELLDVKGEIAIEDLFNRDYFLGFVHRAYAKELGDKTLKLKQRDKRTIVDQVEDALAKKGIGNFNKGRVAKLILKDMAAKSLSDFDDNTTQNFEAVVAAIVDVVAGWEFSA